ncbi:MAG: ATPase, T2SS/T4P/T4SS family [Candidatus Coatesbacteria bacterium]
MTEPATPRTPPPDDFDGTLRQTDEAVGKTRDLSVPTGVEQQANAPRIAGYVLTALLGQGAYAQVWKAWQVRTRKWVAIKCFLARGGVNWMLLQREMERLIRLDKHPHIVSLLDADLTADPAWYALDLLEAGSLEQYVDPAKLVGVDSAAKWMEEIAEALSYVHTKGIIHCDLKPANVLLDDMGHARVADFGQSKVLNESSGALGTLFYMAPEQAMISQGGAGIQPDVRWDVYALGASAYAVLTGKVPNLESLKDRLTTSPGLEDRLSAYRELTRGAVLPSAREVRGLVVDEDLSAIVGKCLAYDPDARYDSMGAVLADLKARRESRPVTPLAASRRYRTGKFLRRNAILVAVCGIALVALAGAFSQVVRKQRLATRQLADSYLLRAEQMAAQDDVPAAAIYSAEANRILPSAVARMNGMAFLSEMDMPVFEARDEHELKLADFCADGAQIVTLCDEGEIRRWDAETGKPVRGTVKLAGAGPGIAFAEISQDRRTLLTCGDGGKAWGGVTVRVWDVATGKAMGEPLKMGPLMTIGGWNLGAIFSPDGGRVLTFGNSAVARLWDGRNLRAVGKGFVCGSTVRAAAFSPDGMSVATGGQDGVQLWNIKSGKALNLRHGAEVSQISFSRDGRLLVVAGGAGVRVWDTRTGKQVGLEFRHDKDVKFAALSPDGSGLLTGGDDQTGRMWDVGTGELVRGDLRHHGMLLGGEFSQYGTRVLTGAADNTARVWGPEPGNPPLLVLHHERRLLDAVFGPDGTKILTRMEGGSVRIWDVAQADRKVRTIRPSPWLADVRFNPRRNLMAVVDGYGAITLFRRARRGWTYVAKHPSLGGIQKVFLDSEGKRVVGVGWDNSLAIRDAGNGEIVAQVPPGPGECLLAMPSPDGLRIVTVSRDAGSGDFVFRAFRMEDGKPDGKPFTAKGGAPWLALSPDCRNVVLKSGDGKTTRVFDLATGSQVGSDMRHDSIVRYVHYGQDGEGILVITEDGKVRLWDPRTGRAEGRAFSCGQILALIRAEDGWRALEGRPGSLRIWDAKRGVAVGRDLWMQGGLTSVSAYPGGGRLLTGCNDGSVQLWDLRTGSPIGSPVRFANGTRSVDLGKDGTAAAFNWVEMRVWSIHDTDTAVEPDDLVLRAQVMTRCRVDEAGRTEVLTPAAWQALSARLSAGKPAGPEGSGTADWSAVTSRALSVGAGQVDLAGALRELGRLMSSGAPILDALDAVGKKCSDRALAEAFGEVRKSLREGMSLAGPMRATGAFPPLVIHLVSAGCEIGKLDAMLIKAADLLRSPVAGSNSVKAETAAAMRAFEAMTAADLRTGQSLAIIGEWTANTELRKVLSGMADELNRKVSLPAVLAAHVNVFGATWLGRIPRGSEGDWNAVLKALADSLEEELMRSGVAGSNAGGSVDVMEWALSRGGGGGTAGTGPLPLGDLGLDRSEQGAIDRALSAGRGLILFTGPDGSGKTTTAIAALARVRGKKIHLVGEHVEELERAGASFLSTAGGGLGSALELLAKKPAGVVLVGDLGDASEIRLVGKLVAAGHLVIAVARGDDCAEVVARFAGLVDPATGKPVDAKAFSDALSLVVSQRLLRRVCRACAIPAGDGTGEFAGVSLMKGAGCPACGNSGFKGRVASFELLPATAAVRAAVAKRARVEVIRSLALKEGLIPMRQAAVAQVKAGLTTPDEFRKGGFR